MELGFFKITNPMRNPYLQLATRKCFILMKIVQKKNHFFYNIHSSLIKCPLDQSFDVLHQSIIKDLLSFLS